MAAEIGSNKSTVYRFLSDLGKLGIVYKDPLTEKYSLGLKLFELGNRVHLKSAFAEKSHPELLKVAHDIAETVHLAVFKNYQVFHLDKVESPQGLSLSSRVGSYGPAYCTALGKVLLSYLSDHHRQEALEVILEKQEPRAFTKNTITDFNALQAELNDIRSRGYAIDNEEAEIGLICVGIPVYNLNREVVASLSASGPANRFRKDQLASYVSILKKGADAIQHKIGYFKP